MANKDFFYLQLEKIFIENRMYMQPWFENAASPEELKRLTKEELEKQVDKPHRAITDEDINRLFRISMSRIVHYKYKG